MAHFTSHILKSVDDKSCSPGLHILTAEVCNSWTTVSSSGSRGKPMSKSSHLGHVSNWTRNKNAQDENIKVGTEEKNPEEMKKREKKKRGSKRGMSDRDKKISNMALSNYIDNFLSS